MEYVRELTEKSEGEEVPSSEGVVTSMNHLSQRGLGFFPLSVSSRTDPVKPSRAPSDVSMRSDNDHRLLDNRAVVIEPQSSEKSILGLTHQLQGFLAQKQIDMAY